MSAQGVQSFAILSSRAQHTTLKALEGHQTLSETHGLICTMDQKGDCMLTSFAITHLLFSHGLFSRLYPVIEQLIFGNIGSRYK